MPGERETVDRNRAQSREPCSSEILAVKGNHDSSGPFREGIRNLHLATHVVSGIRFGGFNGSWRYKPRGNYLFEQEEVERLMAGFPPVGIFASHNSPRGIHDRDDEVHLGFVAFTNYITRHQPKLWLHGHQHVNAETMVEKTQVIGVFGYRLLDL